MLLPKCTFGGIKYTVKLLQTPLCPMHLRCQLGTASTSSLKDIKEIKPSYDVVVIGSGHNGLVSAAYLQKAGYSVCVLEKRHVVGGAAVTEEIVKGFKFSRASYVLSLLRPFIISDLKLKEFGLKFYLREPYSSYTPIKESQWSNFKAKSLLLSSDAKLTQAQIAQFSERDAQAYHKYEEEMSKFVDAVVALLDSRPPNISNSHARFSIKTLKAWKPLWTAFRSLGTQLPEFHETLTASAAKILDKWFESEPLKATLGTDAVIGTMSGPHTAGTGYVLLHHIMGGIDGKPGAWAYPEGGMGGVTSAMAASASSLGVDIFTNQEVKNINYSSTNNPSKATGVITTDGHEIKANLGVFSCATPHVTFKKLTTPEMNNVFGEEFVKAVDAIDYTSPVTKINVALSELPNFTANPNISANAVGDHHKCTIHLNCESMKELAESYDHCMLTNTPSRKPMIEMVIPSSLDPTLTSTPGSHVCLMFTQYTPYSPSDGHWSDANYKEKYAQAVFDTVEEYAPGFKKSIVGKEVLSPWDLEQTFGLTGGNIFHGSMAIDQLYWLRPILSRKCWFPETPVKGLYLAGSGSHPGGGVMGLPGYLAAKAFIDSLPK